MWYGLALLAPIATWITIQLSVSLFIGIMMLIEKKNKPKPKTSYEETVQNIYKKRRQYHETFIQNTKKKKNS